MARQSPEDAFLRVEADHVLVSSYRQMRHESASFLLRSAVEKGGYAISASDSRYSY